MRQQRPLRPDARIKIIYYHHPGGKRVFTVTPFCSELLKTYANYRDPSRPAGSR